MKHADPPRQPLSVKSACAIALGWLAVRDLTIAEIATRLRRRGCADEVIRPAIEHLRTTGAIDDERVAKSRARVEASIRGRGRVRVLLRLRSMGIDEETARRAVDSAFEEVDQDALLQRALSRRLKGPAAVLQTPAEYRRIYAALIRQGFPPADVRKALERRNAGSADFTLDDSDANS